MTMPKAKFLPIASAANMLAPPSWRFFVSLMAMKHGVMQREILSPIRTAKVAAARQEAMALAYRHTLASLPQVGRWFDRDHTTVLHALTKLGARTKLVKRMPTVAAPIVVRQQTAPPKNPVRDAKGRYSKPRTALQRAVLRAYQNNIPASVVAAEYGCSQGSVKVIAHHMRLKRRPKAKYGFGEPAAVAG